MNSEVLSLPDILTVGVLLLSVGELLLSVLVSTIVEEVPGE